MPKRSNVFQRLVAAVHGQLSPAWTVQESRLLEDSITHEPREVDIVAESSVAGHNLCLSIECRDSVRAADVTWIEAMAKKHEHLATSKLVLWSRSGFSKAAARKASALKIDLVPAGDTMDIVWARLARDLVGGMIQYLEADFSEAFVDVESSDGSRSRHDASLTFTLRSVSGSSEVEARVGALLVQIRSTPGVGTTLLDHAPDGTGTFHIEYEPPFPCDVYDQAVRLGRLVRLGVVVQTVVQKAPLKVRSILYEGKVFTMASADLQAGRFDVLVAESPDALAKNAADALPNNDIQTDTASRCR